MHSQIFSPFLHSCLKVFGCVAPSFLGLIFPDILLLFHHRTTQNFLGFWNKNNKNGIMNYNFTFYQSNLVKMSFLLHGATILRSFIIVFINIPHLFVIIRYNFFPTQNKHMYYMHACINAVFNYHHIAYAYVYWQALRELFRKLWQTDRAMTNQPTDGHEGS